MGQTSIRLSEEAKARLDEYKRRGESYEDVIRRLTTKEKWAGFGAFSVDKEGMEDIRQEFRGEMDVDVDDLAE
jgi:predicted CopG family antitoxin